MALGQRPRPRAKQASIDVTQTSSSENLSSTLSPRTTSFATSHNDDENDDDNFFTKRRNRNGPVLSHPIPTIITEDLMSGESEDDEVAHEGVGADRGSSDDGSPRRKRAKRQLSSWTKTSSHQRAEKLRHSSRHTSTSEELDGQSTGHIARGMNARRGQRESRSPSLTPPPPLDKETLQRLETVLKNYNTATAVEEEEGDASFSQNTVEQTDLDPDLARAIRGDLASDIRRRYKERDAERLQEEEKSKRLEGAEKNVQGDVIDLMDSDEDDRPTNRTRDGMSSSPVEVVSSSIRSRVLMHPHAPSVPAPARGTAREEEDDKEQEEEQVEEEVKRIDIVMKGGPGGTLTANVKVKPTTQMQRLLDHYISTHKSEIPKGKLKSIRIRFDGEWIKPKDTIGQLSLEDDDQVDVIW
ncbi:hypothetical protein CBS101457_002749 [Exobasidium rhododendri]|nr:hypothetical protein CBS101457_002749 [Exobasidium rhododendri]